MHYFTLSKFHLLLGSNEVKIKPSSFTCHKGTLCANFSSFTWLLSLATSCVTRWQHFYCKLRIILQLRWHLTVMPSVYKVIATARVLDTGHCKKEAT